MRRKIVCLIAIFVMLFSTTAVYAQTDTLRLSGSNKFKTAYAVADYLYRKKDAFDSIIVVNRDRPADAISSGYLSHVKGNIPVILWREDQNDKIIEYTKSKMKAGGTLYIVGGKSAVPKSFESLVKNSGITVKRIAGPTKYDTNLEALKETFKKGDELMVVSNTNRLDAVPSNAAGRPLMLIAGGGSTPISEEQIAWLKKSGVSKIYIIGDTDHIKSKAENILKDMAPVERIAGKNSIATADLIAKQFFPKAKKAVVLKNYADGLVASPLAYTWNAPILLVNDNNYGRAHNYAFDKHLTGVFVIGDESVVAKDTVEGIISESRRIVDKAAYDETTYELQYVMDYPQTVKNVQRLLNDPNDIYCVDSPNYIFSNPGTEEGNRQTTRLYKECVVFKKVYFKRTIHHDEVGHWETAYSDQG